MTTCAWLQWCAKVVCVWNLFAWGEGREERRKDLEAKILGWKDNLLKERGGEG